MQPDSDAQVFINSKVYKYRFKGKGKVCWDIGIAYKCRDPAKVVNAWAAIIRLKDGDKIIKGGSWTKFLDNADVFDGYWEIILVIDKDEKTCRVFINGNDHGVLW